MTLRSDFRPIRPRNHLLGALPAADWKRLRASLEYVELPVREILIPSNAAITHAYFPEEGVVSLVQNLADGTASEVGLVGNEGFVGIPLVLGARTSPSEANVQLAGSALRITTKALCEAIQRSKPLNVLLLRFANAFHSQVAQTAACNNRHELHPRLARWLLSALDRVDGNELALSHEFLSMMIGRRRAGVTVALGALKQAGLLTNSYDRIQIIDRRGLEKVACECYRVVRDEYRKCGPKAA
jgi:CRP-like cAMP-binding protein